MPYVSRATQIGKQRWDAVRAGGGHACGLRDGHLYCWGRNDRGQISDLIAGNAVEPYEIAAPKSGVTWSVVGWGDHRFGAVGAGTITKVAITEPRKIEVDTGGEPWVQLVSGYGFSCARTQGGRAFCWGFSQLGALGSSGAASPLPIAVQLAL